MRSQKFPGRREDDRLITGRGRYTDDWTLPDQVFGVFIRSDVAHARLTSIDVEAAAEAEGVLAILTAADLAHLKRPPARMPYQDAQGPMRAPDVPPLAREKVRYVGEPVALVVGTTEAAARTAADLIEISYDPLPVVNGVTDALRADAPQLHEAVPGNLCFDYRYGDEAATDALFATAAHVVSIELTSERVIGNPMEPKAALVNWVGDELHLWCSHQGPGIIAAELAEALGIPERKIMVHAEDIGGAFGVRGAAAPEHVALAEAARRLGRPVKWTASRSETFVSDFHGRGNLMRAELGLDSGGRFLALRHDWLCDLGAYPSASGPITVVQNASLMACGAYRIEAVSGRKRLVLTNRVPVTAYRGAGRPDMAYVIERLVDKAACRLGMDRIELRRRNFIGRDQFPYPITTGPIPASYDSGDFEGLLSEAKRLADWDGFEQRRAEAAQRGRLRGIGCAVVIEPAGGGVPVEEALITLDADGIATIHGAAASSGQGHETVYPEIVAGPMQIPAERIVHRGGRGGTVLKGGAAFASRTTMALGPVVDRAANLLVEKGRALAAEHFGVNAERIDYVEGAYHVRGQNQFLPLAELARTHPGALDTRAELPVPRAFPSGAHVAEVEIDPETGAVELVHYVAVDDCGTVLNQTLVDGQILGGLMQGLGQAFGETCVYGDDGQLLTGTFMDYAMPRADLLGRVSLANRGIPSPTNHLGVKGVGEAGTVGSIPTAMNAVIDALRLSGVSHLDMPATPYRIWQAIQDAKAPPSGPCDG